MSEPLLWLVTAIYAAVGLNLAVAGKHGLALCFLGYVIANVGLILAMKS